MRSRDWGSQSRSRLQPHEPHTSFNLQSRGQQIPPIKKARAYLTRGTGHTLELQSMKEGQPRDVVTHLKSCQIILCSVSSFISNSFGPTLDPPASNRPICGPNQSCGIVSCNW